MIVARCSTYVKHIRGTTIFRWSENGSRRVYVLAIMLSMGEESNGTHRLSFWGSIAGQQSFSEGLSRTLPKVAKHCPASFETISVVREFYMEAMGETLGAVAIGNDRGTKCNQTVLTISVKCAVVHSRERQHFLEYMTGDFVSGASFSRETNSTAMTSAPSSLKDIFCNLSTFCTCAG